MHERVDVKAGPIENSDNNDVVGQTTCGSENAIYLMLVCVYVRKAKHVTRYIRGAPHTLFYTAAGNTSRGGAFVQPRYWPTT